MDVDILQHFRPSEENFIHQIDDAMARVLDTYAPVLLSFHDPRQQFITESVVGRENELKLFYNGGYEGSERKRALIAPNYFEPTESDFELSYLSIKYPEKFGELSHPQILGSFLSSGIDRKYFGDIISDGSNWQIIIDKTIHDYVHLQTSRIGKMKVHLEPIHSSELLLPKDFWEVQDFTVSSLRVDVLISGAFNLSRQRAKVLINQEKVKVNWREINRTDEIIHLMDIISIRGVGRIQLQNIRGNTKRDRIRITCGILNRQ
ncbi:RNA-binding protein [Atopobacter phocae]|uniref:YlmH family RNA-binding protein n=1 Tax=Atopobacter phocae TaxID=136492 RepID=UPI00046F64B3|nr:YlmH/Sll1252 family protein [Atopobacter phocae]